MKDVDLFFFLSILVIGNTLSFSFSKKSFAHSLSLSLSLSFVDRIYIFVWRNEQTIKNAKNNKSLSEKKEGMNFIWLRQVF